MNQYIMFARFPKKRHLVPKKDSESLGPEKLPEIVNCATIKETKKIERNNGGGPSGIGGWLPISTWIICRCHLLKSHIIFLVKIVCQTVPCQ